MIAKKIEDAENRVLERILDFRIGIETIFTVGKNFVDAETRMKNWIKGFDDDEASNNEEVREEKIRVKTVETLKLFESHFTLINKKIHSCQTLEKIKASKLELFEQLKDLNINRKILTSVIEMIASYNTSIREARQDIYYYAKRLSCSYDDCGYFLKTLSALPQNL